MFARLWFPPSSVFVVGLAVLGILPAIRAPFPSLSLATALGTWIYLGALTVLSIGYLVADRRERRARKKEQDDRDRSWRLEQKERDAVSERRYIDGIAAVAILGTDMKATVQLESAKWRSAMESRDALLARGVPANSPQVQELAESARSSAVTIRSIVITPATGDLTLTGYPPEVTISESKAPLFVMPRVSSSGKPSA